MGVGFVDWYDWGDVVLVFESEKMEGNVGTTYHTLRYGADGNEAGGRLGC
jgi:hypothetical protein